MKILTKEEFISEWTDADRVIRPGIFKNFERDYDKYLNIYNILETHEYNKLTNLDLLLLVILGYFFPDAAHIYNSIKQYLEMKSELEPFDVEIKKTEH